MYFEPLTYYKDDIPKSGDREVNNVECINQQGLGYKAFAVL